MNPLHSIRPKMLFDAGNTTWLVVKELTSAIVDGKTIAVDNRKKNKWKCRPLDVPDAPLSSFCFGGDDVAKYNFRMPPK